MIARSLTIAVMLLLGMGAPSGPRHALAWQDLQRYVNERHRCALLYAPQVWRLEVQSGPGSDTAIFTAREDPEVTAALNMFDRVANLTLHPRQLFDMDKGTLATIFGGLEIREERLLTLSGATAHLVTFDGREKRVTRYTIVHDGFVYLLAYVAPKAKYETYLPAFRLIVETFRLSGTAAPDPDPRALPLDVLAQPVRDHVLHIRTRPDPVFVETRDGEESWHYHLVLSNPTDADVEFQEIRVRSWSGERLLEETRLDPPTIARLLKREAEGHPIRSRGRVGTPSGLAAHEQVLWRDHAGHRGPQRGEDSRESPSRRTPESIEYVFFFRQGGRLWRQTHRVALIRYHQKTRFTLPFDGIWRVRQGHEIFEEHRQRADAQAFAFDFVFERGGRDRIRPGERRPRSRSPRRGRSPAPISREPSSGMRLADFYAYGQKILAPADGRVVRAVDGEPDRPPTRTRPLFVEGQTARQIFGNYIVLDHGTGEFSLLAHLKRGSLRVRRGDRVRRGQVIAECGNSGVSAQPHLHFHVMDGPDPVQSRGLPIRFERYRLWRDGRAVVVASGIPRRGERIERIPEPSARRRAVGPRRRSR